MKNISIKKEEPTAIRLQPDRWVENYASQLFGYTFARVADEQHAEDIVQSTFFSAWKGREGYNGEASEKNWLFAICKNKIIDYYRDRSRNRDINSESKGEEDIYFDHTGHWTEEAAPKEWGAVMEHPGEDREFYEVLARCTAKLKLIQQQVFSLKYLDDLDAEQICEALKITQSNYWVLIHRAKLHLRVCLEKNWLHLK
ncbi:sigma-70 family RNA polymerase sigma factor [Pollutibacter soli]|uniref:sigma-70 family RNA polymerase sigma factor n=1 Tax=Pollutibacter soli TaxID=3034157 RepID=UPI0030133BD7